ncbi:PIN domain-containing protein [Azospirillum argentinense]
MRSQFREYYPLSEGEFDDLWRTGLIVLDTNVLLRLFRYKQQTANDFLAILEKLEHRLWLPHQVGWEFQRRRLGKIDEARKAYNSIVQTFRTCENAIRNEMASLKEFGIHPLLDLEKHITALTEHLEQSIRDIEDQYSKSPPSSHYDSLFDKISKIYTDSVGTSFSLPELESIYKEGDMRYPAKIPPGFGDNKTKKDRPPQELYGDLIIWKEILRHAKDNEIGVIFVTEDTKIDWWDRTDDGKTIGPLPALRREFFTETNQLFHMYRVGQFAERAAKMLELNINKESTEELKQPDKPSPVVRAEDTANSTFSPATQYLEAHHFSQQAHGILKPELLPAADDIDESNNTDEDTQTFELYKKELLRRWIDTQIKLRNTKTEMNDVVSRSGYDYENYDAKRLSKRMSRLKSELKNLAISLQRVGINLNNILQ